MTPLSYADKDKLSKLLAMLGSECAGKHNVAAQAAHRLVQARGLTWRQVPSPPPREALLPERGTWRKTARELLEHQAKLRAWEIGFLRYLPWFRRLSTKQRYHLKAICGRVVGSGMTP